MVHPVKKHVDELLKLPPDERSDLRPPRCCCAAWSRSPRRTR